MALVSKTIPGFYNGISQQAAPLRLPTQGEDQVNCFSNLVDGITQRPNTEHLATLTSNATAGCMVHEINSNSSDQFIMVLTGDETEPVEVFRHDTGVKCSVRYGILNQDLTRTPCTADFTGGASEDLFTATAHGLLDGEQIDLDGATPAELSSGTKYWVINKTANTFQLSLTQGGSIIEFTDDGGDMTFRLLYKDDNGVKGYFFDVGSLEPNEVFKVITLADTTHILNTNVIPTMNGSTKAGAITGRVQTIADLPTGAGIPSADTSNAISGALSRSTALAADEAGAWVTFSNLLSAGHMTFGMLWTGLTHDGKLGSTKLEFQWVATGAGWTAPNIEHAYLFGNSFNPLTLYYMLPIAAGNWDIRVRRIGQADFISESPGTYLDCNWVGCDLVSWSTGSNIYEITGSADSSAKSYYLQHDGDVWLETVKPGVENKISADSMPHILVLTDENEFTFSTALWGDMVVGDDDVTPKPSFINKKIDNITFFKNRFGILSRENIILSKLGTDVFYDFFPTTAIDVLDDDPIDTPATSGDVTPLRSSMVYDADLILFSDQKQYALSSGDKALTPTNVAITPTTNYDICRKCDPAAAGANVYFVSPKLDFISIREYMILPDSLVTDAADITAHVPNYIPNGNIIDLKALNAFDCLFVRSTADMASVYVYKFYWLGNEKPQSSWSKWEFDGDVLGMATMDSYITMLIERENGEICLEKMYLEREETGTLDWRIHLDRRELLLGAYNSGTDLTTWTSSYDMLAYTDDVSLSSIDYKMIDQVTGFSMPDVTITSATTMTRSGDWSDISYYVGKTYTASFQPTPWYIRDSKDGVVVEGRIQVRSLILSYTDTAYFTVSITPKGRNTLVHKFIPDIVGVSIVDTMTLVSGEKAFPVFANAKDTIIEIASDSYLPFQFSVGSWKGSYHPKARVI